MSVITTCNYCGEVIDPGDMSLAVSVQGRRPGDHFINKNVGHYHADGWPEGSCYRQVLDAIQLMHGVGPSLEQIDTIPEREVRQQRAAHVRPGEPIGELDLTIRAYGLLRRAEIYTVEALTEKSKGQLMSIPGMGWKSLQVIEKGLEKRGLKLRESA